MDDGTGNEVAECLERLADQHVWNPELWQQCYELVQANWNNDLQKHAHDDLIDYDGEFHSRNIFGFRVGSDRDQLEHYRQEFRDITAALRSSMSLTNAKKKYEL